MAEPLSAEQSAQLDTAKAAGPDQYRDLAQKFVADGHFLGRHVDAIDSPRNTGFRIRDPNRPETLSAPIRSSEERMAQMLRNSGVSEDRITRALKADGVVAKADDRSGADRQHDAAHEVDKNFNPASYRFDRPPRFAGGAHDEQWSKFFSEAADTFASIGASPGLARDAVSQIFEEEAKLAAEPELATTWLQKQDAALNRVYKSKEALDEAKDRVRTLLSDLPKDNAVAEILKTKAANSAATFLSLDIIARRHQRWLAGRPTPLSGGGQ